MQSLCSNKLTIAWLTGSTSSSTNVGGSFGDGRQWAFLVLLWVHVTRIVTLRHGWRTDTRKSTVSIDQAIQLGFFRHAQ